MVAQIRIHWKSLENGEAKNRVFHSLLRDSTSFIHLRHHDFQVHMTRMLAYHAYNIHFRSILFGCVSIRKWALTNALISFVSPWTKDQQFFMSLIGIYTMRNYSDSVYKTKINAKVTVFTG